jgi:hypothetical protein
VAASTPGSCAVWVVPPFDRERENIENGMAGS